MQMMEKTLRGWRETIGVSREDVAKSTSVTVGTIRNAELGRKVTRRSALQILEALNNLKKSEHPELTLDDLGLII
jgi:hypothetical protein